VLVAGGLHTWPNVLFGQFPSARVFFVLNVGSAPEERSGSIIADLGDSSPWQTRDKSPSPASRAKKQCRKRNRNEWEVTFLIPGNVRFNSGTVVALDPTFGSFAGNYLIKRVVHTWSATEGYRTQFHARKVLKGY
jgi:hypothetical protein